MRKIIRTSGLPWDEEEYLLKLLDLSRLPELIIIETVEDE